MTERIARLRAEWDERAKRLGSRQRSVLFKRFPAWLNRRVHDAHVAFCLRHLRPDTSSVLDVGCGYGRISCELQRKRSEIGHFQGIELSPTFARAYAQNVGPCFIGPVQEFHTTRHYDAIIVVTVLMYLEAEEHQTELARLWGMLNPDGGRLICIEPAIEFLEFWRRLTRTRDASPTGGDIATFTLEDLHETCTRLPDSVVIEAESIAPISLLRNLTLHHAVALARHVTPAAHDV